MCDVNSVEGEHHPGGTGGAHPLGLVGAVGGILLLAGSPAALSGALEVLLVLAGLDLVVTGATGHCPLYQKLGHMPRSLRRA